MWKLKRTQKYLIEIIHTWVRNEGVEGGGEGAYEALAESWKNRPTKNKTNKKTQAEDEDMGLFGEIKQKEVTRKKRNKPKTKKSGFGVGTQGGTSVTVWRKRGIKHWMDPWFTSTTTTVHHCSWPDETSCWDVVGWAGVLRGSVQRWSINPFQESNPYPPVWIPL